METRNSERLEIVLHFFEKSFTTSFSKRLHQSSASLLMAGGHHKVFARSFGILLSSSWSAKKAFNKTLLVTSLTVACTLLLVVKEEGWE